MINLPNAGNISKTSAWSCEGACGIVGRTGVLSMMDGPNGWKRSNIFNSFEGMDLTLRWEWNDGWWFNVDDLEGELFVV